jgi:thiaminase/transcriptional activator TenA
MTQFSARAWQTTEPLYRKILELPFNRELAAGTLAPERFQFYMLQDALYLEQYARALAVASTKAPDPDAVQFFARAAEQALVVERALHGGFFERFGIDSRDAAAAEPSPTCYGYTNFLLAIALRDGYATLAAAILPCFWIYWEVGKHIATEAAADNPYQAWIDTYSDPGFGDAVETAIALADRAAGNASQTEQASMLDAFTRSAQFEWMFWDSAYRLETWPIKV